MCDPVKNFYLGSHERQERLQDKSVCQAVRLEAETPEKSQERLQHMLVYKAVCFQLETQQQRLERLDKESQSELTTIIICITIPIQNLHEWFIVMDYTSKKKKAIEVFHVCTPTPPPPPPSVK